MVSFRRSKDRKVETGRTNQGTSEDDNKELKGACGPIRDVLLTENRLFFVKDYNMRSLYVYQDKRKKCDVFLLCIKSCLLKYVLTNQRNR